jgi:hypothetical protein
MNDKINKWVEVTGRITVDIVLSPKETRLPFDQEAFVADLLDQWNYKKDYILGNDRNDITVKCEVQEITDTPGDEVLGAL